MKKIFLVIVASFLFNNFAFSESITEWEQTDYDTNYYLKNGWKITFVNAYKGKSNDEIIYTLQRQKKVMHCRIWHYLFFNLTESLVFIAGTTHLYFFKFLNKV